MAASLCIAVATKVDVFATGGIGGVHLDAPFDESGDLVELARSPIIVVCAGAKSILDLPATLERLETLGVTVVGYRTDELPGFFTKTTGLRLSARADSVEEIAGIHRAARALGRRQATLVVQPPTSRCAGIGGPRFQAPTGSPHRSSRRDDAIPARRRTPHTEGRSLSTNLGLLAERASQPNRCAFAREPILRDRSVAERLANLLRNRGKTVEHRALI